MLREVNADRLNSILFEVTLTFIALFLLVVLISMSVSVTRRFRSVGQRGERKYIFSVWGVVILFFLFADSFFKTFKSVLLYYIVTAIGFIGAFLIMWRAFKAAGKAMEKYTQKVVQDYNVDTYKLYYKKCPSCGYEYPPGTMFCEECGGNVTVNETEPKEGEC